MMSTAVISFNKTKEINTHIQLSGSKSESNRALILRALSNNQVSIENLSDAADTKVLADCLESLHTNNDGNTEILRTIDVGPAGTAMRFLTAYLSLQPGKFLLTGSDRMKERPIKLLVDALRSIGAEIEYTGNEGYPPIQINGGFKQTQGIIKINGNVSSQYISALLLVASSLPKGLTIEIEDTLTSAPYVEMTLEMLSIAGIRSQWTGNTIQIETQSFQSASLSIEPDWSAASYWYSIAALADKAFISINGLAKYSLQGDSRITEIMANFGMETTFKPEGMEIATVAKAPRVKIFDLSDCPDLAQTVIVYCAAAGLNMKFIGLETLKIKETNRIQALQTELAKIGVRLLEGSLLYTLDTSDLHFPEKLTIATYHDHRMAMAFAPLALRVKELCIEDANVVNKSYPGFWKDLEKARFDVLKK